MGVAGNQVRAVFLLVALLFVAACGGAKSDGTTSTTGTSSTSTDTSTAATTTTGTDTGTGTGTGTTVTTTGTATATTTDTGTAVTTKVTLSGSVSGTLAKPSSKPSGSGTGTFHSPMSGGEVKVIDSKGNVAGTGTIAADGTYSASVDKGDDYVVKATKGNVCLKSYVEKANADKSVTVDPTSSAIVKVLAKKVGHDKLGDEGEDVSGVISTSNVSAIIAAISGDAVLNQIAAAIQNDISQNANYSSTTVTVGVVSTAGDSEANTIVLNITITVNITNNSEVVTAPAAPTGVSLTAGDGQVTVSWNAITDATSYNVYYSTTAGVAGIKINGITTGTSYTQTGLTNGTTYYFTVTASKSGLESIGSAQGSATPQVPVAGAPTDVVATSGNGQVLISWTAVTGTTSYNVYWRTSAGVTIANGTKISGITGTSHTLTGLTNGTAYYLIVTAVNGGGESAASGQVGAAPKPSATNAPIGLTATAGNGQVALSWTATTGADSYNIYWSTSSGVTQANGTIISGITGTTYTHTGLTNGTTYHYIVTAVNLGGESPVSSQTSAKPQVPAPGVPSGVSALAGVQQVTVSWSVVGGASSYNIYYGTSPGVTKSNGTKITGVTSPYVHTGLTGGTAYYCIVTAVNAGGEGTASTESGATPQIPAPSAPSGLTATAGGGQVTLSWSVVSNATSYNVYYGTATGVSTANGTKVSNAASGGAITGLAFGTTYYFIVTAVNAGGESAATAEVSAIPLVSVAIVAGAYHTVVLKGDGTVWTWGYNQFGELGDGTTVKKSTSVQVLGAGGVGTLTGVTAIAADYLYTVALKGDGTVWAWGVNDCGQLGDGTNVSRTTSVQVLGAGGVGFLTGVTAITIGAYHAVALKNDGTVWTWGRNNYEQLGDGTTTNKATPVQVLGAGGVGFLTGVTEIFGGGGSTFALKGDGTIWAWGYNGEGELGDGTIVNRSTPVQVLGAGGVGFLTGVTAIAVGGNHTIALKGDGTVWAWGYNGVGALGDGTTVNKSTPVQVLGAGGVGFLTGVTAIAVGTMYTVALKGDGTVWAWGWNSNGEVGDGTIVNKSTPVQVLGAGGTGFLTGVTAIAAGGEHTVALKGNGTIWTWGRNDWGQLGDGTWAYKTTPTAITY